MSMLKKLAEKLRNARVRNADRRMEELAAGVRTVQTKGTRELGDDDITQMMLVPVVTARDMSAADIAAFDALLVGIVKCANETPHSIRTLKLSVASLVPRIRATVDRLIEEGRIVATEDGLRPGITELDA